MNFNFKKKFGQNFLTDKNLLAAIVDDSGIDENAVVLEIGPGAGALTQAIAKKAARVVSFEIDKELESVLEENLKDFSNVKVIFKDFMKLSDDEIKAEVGENYHVIANLPYYITSPILFRFFEAECKPKSLTIMVQKEYGERLTASPNTSEYSSLSVLSRWLGEGKIVRKVPARMFTPPPKVDSCIVHYEFSDIRFDKDTSKFIRNCFAMRRKTLVNNLSLAYNTGKDILKAILESNGISPAARSEELSTEQILKLYDSMKSALHF